MKNNFYYIKNNDDWAKLDGMETKDLLVYVSNDAYFGFRAMEKRVKAIIYNPDLIDSLVRVVKDSKKFPNVMHVLELDESTLGLETTISNESFLKASSRLIERILEINPLLCIEFKIKMPSNSSNWEVREILTKLYKENIKKD